MFDDDLEDEEPVVGSVLLDNTTVFGAARAFGEWPLDVDQWREGSLALDVRSLMDVLEATVLHDHLVLDATSRTVGSRTAPAWSELEELPAGPEGDDSSARLVHSLVDDERASAIAERALIRFERYLEDGSVERHHAQLMAAGVPTLPALYANPGEFERLFLESHPGELPPDGRETLARVVARLPAEPSPLGSFVYFAFRGFYYWQWAQVHGMPYVPHAWRCQVIGDDAQRGRVFEKKITAAVGRVRSEAAERAQIEVSGEFPPIASYMAAQAHSRRELLRIALDLRETGPARAFRAWVREAEATAKGEEFGGHSTAQEALDNCLADLRRELGWTQPAGVPFKLVVGTPVVKVETQDARVRSPRWFGRFGRAVRRPPPQIVFLRELAATAAEVGPFVIRFHQLT